MLLFGRFTAAMLLVCSALLTEYVSPAVCAPMSAPIATGVAVGTPGDGVGLSFGLLAGNIPAYSSFSSNDFSLRYSSGIGSAEQTEVVENTLPALPRAVATGVDIPSGTSLAFVGAVPHIFYIHPTTGMLVHAARTSTGWLQETVDTAGGTPSATACGTELCVAYYDPLNGNLKFARGLTGNWSRTIVDGAAEDVGVLCDLAVVPSGRLVVAYFDATRRTVKVATEVAAGGWTVESIPALGRSWGLFPSIIGDSDGTLRVAAAKFQTAQLPFDLGVLYSEKRPGDSWSGAIVSESYVGGETRLFVDSSLSGVVYRYRRRNTMVGDYETVQYRMLERSGRWNGGDLITPHAVDGTAAKISEIRTKRDPWGDLIVAYHYLIPAAGAQPATSGIELHAPSDRDGDGIPDVRELAYSTDPDVADTDTDGLSDGEEILVLHSNPLVGGTATTTTTTSSTSTTTTTLSQTSTTTTTLTVTTTSTTATTATTTVTTSTLPQPGPLYQTRVNAGGGALLDVAGQLWLSDTTFLGGSSYQQSVPIGNTEDDLLYQSERYGSDFSYRFPVPNGDYDVTVHFAELYFSAMNQRIFDVELEGRPFAQAVDIYSVVGANSALRLAASCRVNDGELHVRFLGRVENAKVSALEVAQLPNFLRLIDCGSTGTFIDSRGRAWAADSSVSGGTRVFTSSAISGTIDDKLYKSERRGNTFSYSVAVPNGQYEVLLHFVELNWKARQKRIFDLFVEGSLAIDNLDVYAGVGRHTALIYPVYTTVNDGMLDFRFLASVDQATVSAIEIRRSGP